MTQESVNEWVASVLARQAAEHRSRVAISAHRSHEHAPVIFRRTLWEKVWPASFDARFRREFGARR